MKKYKIIIIIIIFAGVTFFAGRLFIGKKPDEKNAENVIMVKRGDISVSVEVSEVIKPLKVVAIRSRLMGKIMKTPVQKGDYLEEGALIAEIENTYAKSDVERCLVELGAAKARSEQIKYEIGVEKEKNQKLLETAKNNLENAKRELQKAVDREEKKELLKKNNIETESELIKQEVAIRFTMNEIQGKINELSKKEPVPIKELELLKKNLESAKSEYTLVLQYLELTKRPVVKEKIDMEKFGIKQAEQEFIKAKENIKAQEAKEKNLIAAESEVTKKQDALKLAEDNLKDTIITAPITGTIMQMNFEKGQIISSDKTVNSSGIIVATIADLSKICINAEIGKKYLENIKTGQRVNITADGFRKKKFEGRVIRITTKKAEANNGENCRITVEIANPDMLLKPDMKLQFKIVIKEAQNVLIVPNDVIQNVDNKKKVTVKKDGKLIKHEVKTGLNDRNFTEIISGLNEGEIINKQDEKRHK